ncbi:hypothetical protein ACNTMW_28260 [Planosporangium sp. 12N6]|uniref:hypothetical protein n=1 Tax=Planosporangium spinosum TaxID=3402278 RepID=UPI003CED9F9E
MVLTVIVVCEIAFWVVLLAGLAARYPLRRPRLGAVLLAGVPLVDLVLLVATVLDLHGGVKATEAHGLAAVYLGFSVAFGSSMVRWADVRFAHRFAGGPPPRKVPKRGPERVRYEWREFGKGLVAWTVACALLWGAVWYIDSPERTGALVAWTHRLTVVMVIWFVFWPLWETLRQVSATGSERS